MYVKCASKLVSAPLAYVRGKDEYGHPIELNYKGEHTFKTLPGGILSILLKFLLVFYGLLSVNSMVQKVNWSIM